MKKIIKKEKPVERLMKGKKASLIAEGCKLNKIKKDTTKRLDEIKAEIELTKKGTYKNEAGDQLVISESEKFSEIEPKKVIAYLKKNDMSARFPETIKVQITALKKIVPESIIAKWRIALDPIIKFSWK
ncbi:MAG: hypothetical protein P9L97_05760 [Candidatus Tenebribacter davisii]|nr:hypothetical protein [Candidatus Tenebribacter davisii]